MYFGSDDAFSENKRTKTICYLVVMHSEPVKRIPTVTWQIKDANKLAIAHLRQTTFRPSAISTDWATQVFELLVNIFENLLFLLGKVSM